MSSHTVRETIAAGPVRRAHSISSRYVHGSRRLFARLGPRPSQTIAFVALIFGSHALLYVVREEWRI